MLSLSGEQRSRTTRRPPRSLKQEYQEFLLQRIEEYKNGLTREALLEIGDEAVRELEESPAGQYLLTEVLLLEHVDRIIARRLRLPAFPRWRQKHRALRAAQREPTHWGLESDGPLVSAVRRLEPGDLAVVVGAAALPAALFIAAHDAEVFLVDHDLGAVEAAESRAVSEQLAGRFQALVVTFGSWFPDVAGDPARPRGPAGPVRRLGDRPSPARQGAHRVHGDEAGASAGHGVERVGVTPAPPCHSRYLLSDKALPDEACGKRFARRRSIRQPGTPFP